MVTGAAIAEKQSHGSHLKRAGAYVKAHWKELLALVLAAIPALFIVLHPGARKAAQSVLTLSPDGSSSTAGADPSSTISPVSSGSGAAAAAGAAASAVAGAVASAVKPAAKTATSTNGYNPTSAKAPPTAPSIGPQKKAPAPPVVTVKSKPAPVQQLVNNVLHLSGRQGGNIAQ